VAAESLREELMSLDGVAGADVDESQDSPSGVRVRLEPDADARIVGVEVQRVLASHGMRSRITGDDEAESTEDADLEPPVDVTAEITPEETPESVPEPPEVPPRPLEPPPSAVPELPDGGPPSAGIKSGLASLMVEESAEGLVVTATATDGRSLTQGSGPSEEGLFEAVVSAVGALAEGEAPGLIAVSLSEANDTEVVTVTAARADGAVVAGAAVVKVGRAFAVARATWSALRAD